MIEKPDIDGFLVGGASLKPAFTTIVEACQNYMDAQQAHENEINGGAGTGESLFVSNYKY